MMDIIIAIVLIVFTLGSVIGMIVFLFKNKLLAGFLCFVVLAGTIFGLWFSDSAGTEFWCTQKSDTLIAEATTACKYEIANLHVWESAKAISLNTDIENIQVGRIVFSGPVSLTKVSGTIPYERMMQYVQEYYDLSYSDRQKYRAPLPGLVGK